MLKRVLWLAVFGALFFGAYVQETGRDIASFPEPLRTCAQGIRTCSERCSSYVDSMLAQSDERSKPRAVRNAAMSIRGAAVSESRPLPSGQSFVAGAQASGSGTVIRILDDDRKGRQHQRFVLQLASGQTLLIAHNIDLAGRLEALRVGDTVAFCGEYAPNPQGGVIHWTHHDPKGRHPGGWLQYKGRTYQ